MGADGIAGHMDHPFVEEVVVEACPEDDKAVVVVVEVGMGWRFDYHSFFEKTCRHLPSFP